MAWQALAAKDGVSALDEEAARSEVRIGDHVLSSGDDSRRDALCLTGLHHGAGA